MKIVTIGDLETVVGFRLAGVKEGYVVENSKEALKKIEELIKDNEIGLIIINERFMMDIRKDVEALLEGREKPLIVDIPDKKGAIERVDVIKELTRKAVGIEIKLGGE